MIVRLLLLISIFFMFLGSADARTVDKVPGVFYVVLNTRHAGYDEAITRAIVIHKQTRPGNKLSIVLSVDRTLALVKLIGADTAWIQREIGSSGLVAKSDGVNMVYTTAQHDKVKALLQTPAWFIAPLDD